LCRRLLEAIDEKIPKWTRKGDVSNQFDRWRGAFYWKVDFEFSDDFSEFIQKTRTKFTSFIQLIASLQVPKIQIFFYSLIHAHVSKIYLFCSFWFTILYSLLWLWNMQYRNFNSLSHPSLKPALVFTKELSFWRGLAKQLF
jgi:hypothetical protein